MESLLSVISSIGFMDLIQSSCSLLYDSLWIALRIASYKMHFLQVMVLLEHFNVWLCTCVCLSSISRPHTEFSCSRWAWAENTAKCTDQCCELKWRICGVCLLSFSFLKLHSF